LLEDSYVVGAEQCKILSLQGPVPVPLIAP